MQNALRGMLYVLAGALVLGVGHADADRFVRDELNLQAHDRADRTRSAAVIDWVGQRLCQTKVIQVGPFAGGPALSLLAQDFALVLLDEAADPAELRPLVIGPAKLDQARYIVLLQEAYAAGYTVGLTNARPADTQHLHHALGLPSGCGSGDGSAAPLVA